MGWEQFAQMAAGGAGGAGAPGGAGGTSLSGGTSGADVKGGDISTPMSLVGGAKFSRVDTGLTDIFKYAAIGVAVLAVLWLVARRRRG